MSRYRYFTRKVACLAAALSAFTFQSVGVAWAEQAAAKSPKELIAVLESADSPPQDKAITCKHLARLGDKDAVPALSPLLADEQLATWARIALEAIPAPEAGEALRDAASRLEGRLLVGVINSLGMRHDAEAVELLSKKLGDSDSQVAAAAAVALGRIGNEAATDALTKFLGGPAMTSAPKGVQSAVAEGCILCAERLDAEAAVALFDAIRRADVSKQRILEATRGAILAQKAGGIPQLIALLKSDDRAEFALGLWVSRELAGPEATEALVAELERMSPERQALLMLALIDRADRPPLTVLTQSVKQGPKTVRIAAIHAIRRQGDVSCVPALLATAAEADADLAAAATEALEELPGADVNADLATRLTNAEGQTRLTLIELAGRRGIKAAVADLWKAADDADASVRAAAFASLGATIDFASLSRLVDRTVQAKSPDDLAAASDALKTAAGRMPDRDASSQVLASAMPGVGTPAKCKLLDALGAVGGAGALAAITEASKASDADVQGAAAQALGDWMTPDAASALLEMVKHAANDRLKVRALRGYLRIARQFVMSDDARLTMFHAAFDAAQRDDERRLALDVLIRIPSAKTLILATERLAQPALRDAAAEAAITIGAKLAGDQPTAVAEAMQKVLVSGVGDPLKTRAKQLHDQVKAAAQ